MKFEKSIIVALCLCLLMIGSVSATSDNDTKVSNDVSVDSNIYIGESIENEKNAQYGVLNKNDADEFKEELDEKSNLKTINNKNVDNTQELNNKHNNEISSSQINNLTNNDNNKMSNINDNKLTYTYYTTTVINNVDVYAGDSFTVNVYVNGLPSSVGGIAYLYPIDGQYNYVNIINGVATFYLKAPNTPGKITLTGGYVGGTSGVDSTGSSTNFIVNVISKTNTESTNYKIQDQSNSDSSLNKNNEIKHRYKTKITVSKVKGYVNTNKKVKVYIRTKSGNKRVNGGYIAVKIGGKTTYYRVSKKGYASFIIEFGGNLKYYTRHFSFGFHYNYYYYKNRRVRCTIKYIPADDEYRTSVKNVRFTCKYRCEYYSCGKTKSHTHGNSYIHVIK